MKSYTIAIGVGILNFIHGVFHIIQFIQSIILINETHEHHSVWFSILWASIGLISLVIGIRDYTHHKKCKTI
jgi:hypothetical protein